MITKDQLIDRLNKKLIKVEKERDAYREVAAENLSNYSFGQTMKECIFPDQMYEEVDAEAQRLLREKKP